MYIKKYASKTIQLYLYKNVNKIQDFKRIFKRRRKMHMKFFIGLAYFDKQSCHILQLNIYF